MNKDQADRRYSDPPLPLDDGRQPLTSPLPGEHWLDAYNRETQAQSQRKAATKAISDAL